MKIFKIVITLLFLVINVSANSEIILFKVDNSKGKITPETIEKTLADAGYKVQENRDMNGPYKKQFQKTTFDVYNLMTAYYPKIMQELTLKYPDSGIFNPFSVAIYQKKGEKDLYVSILSAAAQSKILGDGEALFKELEALNRKSFLAALPGGEIIKLDYEAQAAKEKLITKFEMEVEDDEALDTKEEVEMVLEDGLKPIGFVMASFNEYNADLEAAKKDDYLYYDVYSLCKLKVIYNVAIKNPEAGAFAPCSMAVYHKKGTNKTVIVFPNVHNWIATLALKDQTIIDILMKAQTDIVKVIESAIE